MPGEQSFAAVSLSSASTSAGNVLGRPPWVKDMLSTVGFWTKSREPENSCESWHAFQSLLKVQGRNEEGTQAPREHPKREEKKEVKKKKTRKHAKTMEKGKWKCTLCPDASQALTPNGFQNSLHLVLNRMAPWLASTDLSNRTLHSMTIWTLGVEKHHSEQSIAKMCKPLNEWDFAPSKTGS